VFPFLIIDAAKSKRIQTRICRAHRALRIAQFFQNFSCRSLAERQNLRAEIIFSFFIAKKFPSRT
jgi:hypothetical protein